MSTSSSLGNRTENTIRNILFGILNKIVVVFLPFVIRTIIIYKLGSEYLGIGSLFTSILQVLSVAELGFASAISFTMYGPVARGELEKIKDSVILLRSIYKIVGFIILLVGLVITPFLHALIKGDVPDCLNIYILFLTFLANTVISYLFVGYKSSILSVYQRNDLISKTGIVVEISKNVLQIFVLLLTANYYLYAIVIPLSTVCSNMIIGNLADRYYPELKTNSKFSLKGIKDISKQIGGIAIGRISLMCRNSFDSIIISAVLGLTAVAIYSNYYLIFSSVGGFIAIILTSMAASVGNSLATKSIVQNESEHIRFDMFYEIIVSFCTICLFCLYQPFMELWVGEELSFPFFTMTLFCIYFYINNLAQIRSVYSEAAGLWWHFKYLTIGEMAANLLLNIGLGIKFGVNGILMATIITAFLGSFIGCSYITYKHLFCSSPMRYFRNNFLYAVIAVVGCCIVSKIVSIVSVTGFLGFFAKASLCVICSAFYLGIVYIVNRKSRKMILESQLLHFKN